MAGSRNKPFTDRISPAITACLARHAQGGDSLVVGFSGGLDSTVLLHATWRIAERAGHGMSALHVHHGLSVNADRWAAECFDTCRKIGVALSVRRVTVARRTGEGLESAARRVRHEVLAEHPADWILLAHHADDQAETMLHNIIRGAGVRGAAAMSELRGRVLRPLLTIARDEIEAYANMHRLKWIEDESNSDTKYTRNFFRSEILPAMARRFPRVGRQLAAAAMRFGEASMLLDELALMDLDGAPPRFPISLERIRKLSEARARNLIRALLTWQRVQPPDERRLCEFMRQVHSAGSDRHPRLDLQRYSIWCGGGQLHFALRA